MLPTRYYATNHNFLNANTQVKRQKHDKSKK
jgi:hypothetical protein